MIYEETYQYLLHNVSSTEFDVCLYSLLHCDWDGVIQAPLSQIAGQVGTTKKYLNQIIKKFTSSKRRNIFIPIQTEEGVKYQINIGPTRNLGFSKKDRYCKKYSFFYDKNFRELSINAKRLLLMAAFRMSIFKNENVMFEYNEIVPNRYSEGNHLFTKSRLMEAINDIQSSKLNNYVKINIASNVFTQNQIILFTFKEGTLDNYQSNLTERTLLRKNIFKTGFQEYLDNSFCIEIEKVGKYLYNSLLKTEKKNAKKLGFISDAKDELLKLARYIYNSSIKKFAQALHSNNHLLAEPKQASAYFSTIIYNEAMDEMAKYAHQSDSIKSLLEYDYLHKDISSKILGRNVEYIEVNEHIEPIRSKYNKAKFIYNIFSYWCEEWVMSRVKSVLEDSETIVNNSNIEEINKIKEKRGWHNLKPAQEYISSLKESVYDQIDTLISKLTSVGNKAISKDERIKFLKQHKESFGSYFAIQNDRVQFLNEVVSK